MSRTPKIGELWTENSEDQPESTLCTVFWPGSSGRPHSHVRESLRLTSSLYRLVGKVAPWSRPPDAQREDAVAGPEFAIPTGTMTF
jgi:hypothetical protein